MIRLFLNQCAMHHSFLRCLHRRFAQSLLLSRAPLLVLLGVETDMVLRWHRSCPVAAMNYTDPQPHDSSKSTSPQRLSINGTVVNAPPGWKRNASAEWDRTEVELK